MRYLPKFLAKDTVFKNTLDICSSQHEKLRLTLIGIAKQMFVETATWGLDDWERMLGIPTAWSDGYAVRRNRVLLKLQGCQTSTLEFMASLMDRFTTRPNGYIEEHNEEYAFEALADADTVLNWREMIGALDLYKPAHLIMYVTIKIIQQIIIKHATEILQFVDARHIVWNQGEARHTCWDGTFCLDGTIRLDGIYGANYRERQHHIVKIWYSIEAVQRNLVPVNVWDGSFCLDGSHTLCGMSLQRPPISKSTANQFSAATMRSEHKLRCQTWPRAEIYLPNLVAHDSNNVQQVASPQTIKVRQRSAATGQAKALHRQIWAYAAEGALEIETPQEVRAAQETQMTLQTAMVQKSAQHHTNDSSGQAAAHHTQAVKQPAEQSSGVAAREKVKIGCRDNGVNQGVARHVTDYRTCNLWDGSFCLDGSHALDGMVYSAAHTKHLCTVATLTKNGEERIERV